MLRQRQSLKLLQKISPQQIQFIKLLQVPTASLETRIKEELEVNPALEDNDFSTPDEEEIPMSQEGDDKQQDKDAPADDSEDGYDSSDDEFKMEDYMDSSEYDYRTRVSNTSPDEEDTDIPVVSYDSFYDRIHTQLDMINLDERQYIITDYLVGSIDEDGYLRRPLPAMVNDIAFIYNVKTDIDELEQLLLNIHRLDPPGIGARNLQECLMLQLKRKKGNPLAEIGQKVLENYFEEFTKKHFSKIRSGLNLSEEEFKKVYELITKLNPKPGERSGTSKTEYIIPDFILNVENGEIDIKLNRKNAPVLKVSNSYLRLLQEYKGKTKDKKDPKVKETISFVKSKIESAQWFIDAIKQRSFTLLNTMYAIAEKQQDFFIQGGDEKHLKPMILKDIADEINMDISTVSRVANSKYVQTEFGIYALKYFFTEGITTTSGEEVSNREVKRILKELIEAESKDKPLSDDKLSQLLKESGYNIARRTVAKYREQMNLPVARLRKEL